MRGALMYLAIDFDGTIVEHRFPEIGPPCPGAFDWLKRYQEHGARLILWTMRSDGRKGDGPENGPVLTQAVEFCRAHGVDFYGVNRNPDQHWSGSPKAYAHVYVDDAAFDCPMVESMEAGKPPHVDWSRVGPELMLKLKKWNARRGR
ncbi:MAG: hypothetical protein KGL39_10670 [Patescibacteria group bacterium]|nr:hypothetical protein [Patescibacteria group bacterium]